MTIKYLKQACPPALAYRIKAECLGFPKGPTEFYESWERQERWRVLTVFPESHNKTGKTRETQEEACEADPPVYVNAAFSRGPGTS